MPYIVLKYHGLTELRNKESSYLAKPHILILDCTPLEEPSEGSLLKQFFKICELTRPAKAKSLRFQVKSKREFLKKIDTRKKYDIIHISAHGTKNTRLETSIGNGRTWSVSAEDIKKTRHKAKLVFVSACVSNRAKLANAFHSKYFLAPMTEVRWDDVALFAITFYKKRIIDNVSLPSAFSFAKKHTKTSGDFPYYWK